MRLLIAVGLLAALAAPAAAQTETYELKLFVAGGAAAPISTTALAPADVTCNQAPTAVASTVNPRGFQWDDPANTGRVCVWRQSAAGPLVSLGTPGVYEAALTRTTPAGTSPESNRASFSLAPLPAAVTGLRSLR